MGSEWQGADQPILHLLSACKHPMPQLVSLHFTGEPPSLQAQLLPLPLAELNAGGE